jgi:hypothetical protein
MLFFPMALVALFVLVLAIPVILLNINAYVRRMWKEQRRTNELLEALRRPREAPAPSSRVDTRR